MLTMVRTFSAVCKLFLCLLLLHTFLFGIAQGKINSKKVTIDVNNATLREVFLKITAQTGYDFTYTNEDIDERLRITGKYIDQDIETVLTRIFEGRGVDFRFMGNVIIIRKTKILQRSGNFDRSLSPGRDSITLINVEGKILDGSNNPLEGATILLKDASKGTQTNDAGYFKISQVPENAILTISYTGFITREIRVKGQSKISILLQQDVMKMDEVAVVSTGYQKVPKERATGSFVFVDNQLLNRRVSKDILSRLEGVVPGLLFNRNTVYSQTKEQGGLDLSVRGRSTLFANSQPLIILDNFPYDGDLGNINPNDIEDITVLKDAAAASIWGVRSGNGVIVITTKRGARSQKTSIEFNGNITAGEKPDIFYQPNFIKSSDFINIEKTLFDKGYYNSDLNRKYVVVSPVVALLAKARAGEITAADANTQINSLNDNDYRGDFKKYLFQKSVSQQYAVNLKGGGDYSDYFFSFGYNKDLANLKRNKNNRITINSLYNLQLSKRLTFSFGLNLTQSSTKDNNNLNQVNAGTKGILPYTRLIDSKGNNLSIVKDLANAYKDTVGGGKLLNWQYKPLDELENADKELHLTDTRITLGIKYKVLHSLAFDLKYLYEKAFTRSENYYNSNTYYARNLINRFAQVSGNTVIFPIPLGGILDQSNSYLTANRGRGQLTFAQKWNTTHDLSAILGMEISQAITEGNANTLYGYDKNTTVFQTVNIVDNFSNLPNGSSRIPTSIGIYKYIDRYISYFSNAAYTFKGRYTASLSGRIDKSNLFGVNVNQKSVPLYSAGVSWNLSKEKFYKLNWLPYSKLRMTFGYNGNVNKSVTALTTFNTSPNSTTPYYGIPSTEISNPGNPELRWEKIRMINWGFDFATANQVVSGAIEFYTKRGIDLFGDAPLPGSTGLSRYRGNTSMTKGHGWDITINTKNIERGNFSWVTNFLMSYAIDKVTKYDVKFNTSQYISGAIGNGYTVLPIAGRPIFGVYSYKWAGLDPVNGDPQGYIGGKVSKDWKNIISGTATDSLVYHGSSRPTTFGSLRNTISYKGLSLSFNVIYKLGYYFRRSSINYSALYQAWSMNKDYYLRWQKPGDEKVTNVPSLAYPPVNSSRENFYANSETLVEKGDHIRLQDLNISYDIEKLNFQKLPFSHLQVYSYINNIGILWRANRVGLDPDLYGSNLPLPRTYTIGVKAIF